MEEGALQSWLAAFKPGSEILRIWKPEGGISSAMTAFTFRFEGETATWVLRQPNDWVLEHIPDPVKNEFELLRFLSERRFPAPEPIAYDETDQTFGRPSLVLEYVEGTPILRPADLTSFLREWANVLAKLHRITQAEAPSFLATESWFEGYELFDIPSPDPMGIGLLVRLLADLGPIERTNPPVLLHTDLWPGNFIWHEGELVACIDWEEARTGEPLIDLALCRLDVAFAFGDEAIDEFTSLYLGFNPVDVTTLPKWDLVMALRASQLAGKVPWAPGYLPFGRDDITTETMTEARQRFIDRAVAAL